MAYLDAPVEASLMSLNTLCDVIKIMLITMRSVKHIWMYTLGNDTIQCQIQGYYTPTRKTAF